MWAHTGIWTKCDLVEVGVAGAGEAGLRWECWDMISLQSQSTLIRSELSVAGVGALLTVAATLFSCYSISHPRYTYRRLAAVLHTLAAVCVLVVIQLVDGGARSDTHLWAMLDEAPILDIHTRKLVVSSSSSVLRVNMDLWRFKAS